MQHFGSASGFTLSAALGFTQGGAFPTRYNMSYIPLGRDISHAYSTVIVQPRNLSIAK